MATTRQRGPCSRRVLELSRAAGGGRAVGITLSYLGLVALQEGDYATARAWLQEALGTHQEAQSEFGIVLASTRLGHVAHAEGDLAEARARYEQSLAAVRRSGDKRAVATLLRNLGMVDVDEGQVAVAWSRFEESAALVRHLRDLAGTAMLLDGLAALAATQDQSGRALRLAGAAAALREALGKSHPHNLRDWLERKLAPARAALGTDAAAAAWAEGHAMGPDRAVAYGLDAAAPGASA